ncbi:MAG: Rpn family recombination-promoting nuclease/putative transposase, partial [Treponema sp.]|nr:Rpn family recombination-promoting nuclease/putative transposase [Treponema sp.]MCL2238137.1 Rpn family recombination-promoting nuclease/putative transposase [Treponema sp.]
FEKWTLFFRFAQDPVHRGKINDIIKEKEEINMAATLLREISQDEHERARYLSRMKFETDQYSNLHTAEKRGELRSDEKWQGVVADKEAEIERLRKQIADMESKG